ncbi:MAG: OmpA family protein [Flavobacteriales bacterium]|nr:OmpA family protein [Flavobacteriales bacterium]
MGAIFIKDSVVVCDRPGRGFGNVLEIKENPATDLQWLEREHHSTWYLFRAPAKTELTFDILPKDPEDDIDFLLFHGNVPDICEKVRTKQLAPVRSNISRNDKRINSMCGLNKDATEEYVRSGVGSSYSKALPVEEGELYYLLVDYQDRPRDGFTIRFHYDPVLPAPVAKELPQALLIEVTDAETGKPVEAALALEGMYFDSVVQAKGNSHYTFRMDTYRKLRISCLQQGYMFQTLQVRPSGEPEVKVAIQLARIAPGAMVVLEDIRFVGNDSKVMRSSEGALYMLLQFMVQNPSARIEIQGHVNGPSVKRSMTTELVELSAQRAQTVFNFLLVNDVDPARMAYVGMGNSQMLFPEPKNKEESEANRRVEVRITGYEELATPLAPAPRRPSH